MKDVWAWILGIGMGLVILALVAYGRSERRAYWAAHVAVVHAAQGAPVVPPVPLDRRIWHGR